MPRGINIRLIRWLDLIVTDPIVVTGVVLFLVLPWSVKGWVVPIAVGVAFLNELVFALVRRYARSVHTPSEHRR